VIKPKHEATAYQSAWSYRFYQCRIYPGKRWSVMEDQLLIMLCRIKPDFLQVSPDPVKLGW